MCNDMIYVNVITFCFDNFHCFLCLYLCFLCTNCFWSFYYLIRTKIHYMYSKILALPNVTRYMLQTKGTDITPQGWKVVNCNTIIDPWVKLPKETVYRSPDDVRRRMCQEIWAVGAFIASSGCFGLWSEVSMVILV